MMSVSATASPIDKRVISRREMSQTVSGVYRKSEVREEEIDLETIAVA